MIMGEVVLVVLLQVGRTNSSCIVDFDADAVVVGIAAIVIVIVYAGVCWFSLFACCLFVFCCLLFACCLFVVVCCLFVLKRFLLLAVLLLPNAEKAVCGKKLQEAEWGRKQYSSESRARQRARRAVGRAVQYSGRGQSVSEGSTVAVH